MFYGRVLEARKRFWSGEVVLLLPDQGDCGVHHSTKFSCGPLHHSVVFWCGPQELEPSARRYHRDGRVGAAGERGAAGPERGLSVRIVGDGLLCLSDFST
jgi:hypothetical protein